MAQFGNAMCLVMQPPASSGGNQLLPTAAPSPFVPLASHPITDITRFAYNVETVLLCATVQPVSSASVVLVDAGGGVYELTRGNVRDRMSLHETDVGSELYTVHVEQADGEDWETLYTYHIEKGLILPAHEALRAVRDFVSETYGGKPVDTPCRARVCDDTESAVVLSLSIP